VKTRAPRIRSTTGTRIDQPETKTFFFYKGVSVRAVSGLSVRTPRNKLRKGPPARRSPFCFDQPPHSLRIISRFWRRSSGRGTGSPPKGLGAPGQRPGRKTPRGVCDYKTRGSLNKMIHIFRPSSRKVGEPLLPGIDRLRHNSGNSRDHRRSRGRSQAAKGIRSMAPRSSTRFRGNPNPAIGRQGGCGVAQVYSPFLVIS